MKMEQKHSRKNIGEKFNAPVIDKTTGEAKLKNDGTKKIKGHVATLA